MPGISLDEEGIKSGDAGLIGGWANVVRQSVGATAVVLIPDGNGDVQYVLRGSYVIRASDGTVYHGATAADLAPGDSEPLVVGISDEFTLRVNADGSVDVLRTNGSLTYTINITLQWI